MIGQLFDGVNRGLSFWVWVEIEAIEVFAKYVHSKMSVIDAINIYHGNNHEHKHLSEKVGSEVFFIRQKIDDSFHGK